MATIIKAGNATDGVQISSDATGALDIKTGTGAGTTAISIDASQNVTIAGSLTVGGGTVYNLEQYTSPATWTKPAGLNAIKVTVVGAGGDGGGALVNTQNRCGGGGGGGAAIEFIPAPSIPGPQPVTAGTGTNSFGAFCSATAGATGTAGGTDYATGGDGGAGSGGSINLYGQPGRFGTSVAATPTGPAVRVGGSGGSSVLGGGSGDLVLAAPTSTAGLAGVGFGSGGSGAVKSVVPAASVAGGTGAPGIVIIEEFY